jgi:hypothetical protein
MKFRVLNQIWTFSSIRKREACPRSVEHWPRFNDPIEETIPLVLASLPNQGFKDGLNTWTELPKLYIPEFTSENSKGVPSTTVGTL